MDANKRSTLADVGSENGSDLLSFWKKVGSTESIVLLTW